MRAFVIPWYNKQYNRRLSTVRLGSILYALVLMFDPPHKKNHRKRHLVNAEADILCLAAVVHPRQPYGLIVIIFITKVDYWSLLFFFL